MSTNTTTSDTSSTHTTSKLLRSTVLLSVLLLFIGMGAAATAAITSPTGASPVTVTSGEAVTVNYDITDNSSPISNVTINITDGTSNELVSVGPTPDNGTGQTATPTIPSSQTDGSYDVKLWVNESGTTYSATQTDAVRVNDTVSSVSVSSGQVQPTDTITVTGSADTNEDITFQLTDPDGDSAQVTKTASTSYSVDIDLSGLTFSGGSGDGLSDGTLTVEAEQDDADASFTSEASGTTTVDGTAPTLSGASRNTNTKIDVTITDNQDVDEASITAADFSLSPGSISSIQTTESGTDATVTITLSNPVDTETVDVSIASGQTVSDVAGNTLTESAGAVKANNMDGVAPSISNTTLVDQTDGNAAVRDGDTVRVSATVTDGTGVSSVTADTSSFDGTGSTTLQSESAAGTDWDGDGNSAETDVYGADVTVTTSGTEGTGQSVTVSATDTSSSSNSDTSPSFGAVDVDFTAPTTTDDAPTGWQDTDTTVTLSPSDSVSGVASTSYCVDQSNDCGPGSGSTGTSVTVTSTGTNYVRYRSTDNAGNQESTQSATVKIDKQAVSIDSATTTSTTTIDVSLSDDLSGFDVSTITAGDFSVSTGQTVSNVDTSSLSDGDTSGTVTLTLQTAMSTGATPDVSVTSSAGGISDIAGNSLTSGSVTASDGVAPQVNSITTMDSDSDGKVDSALVRFSEAVDDSSFTASDWSIGGQAAETTDTGAASDDTDIALNITTDANEVSGTDAKDVTYSGTSVTDDSGNQLANIVGGDISESDGAAPQILTSNVAGTTNQGANDTITVTFTETVNGAGNSANWDGFESPVGSALTTTNADFSYSGSTFTLTLDEARDDEYLKNGDSVVVDPSTSISDGNGNAVPDSAVTSGSTVSGDSNQPAVSSATITEAPINQSDAGDTQTVTVTFDEAMDQTVAPTVQITGLPTSGSLSVSGSYDNATTWTGTVTIPDNDEDTTATVDTSGVEDLAGNSLGTQSGNTFTVDTVPPTISTSLTGSQVLSGSSVDLTQYFTVSSGDGETTTYEYSTDGGSTWTPIGDSNAASSFDTTALSSGETSIQIGATVNDNCCNANRTVGSAKVDNNAPSIDSQATISIASDANSNSILNEGDTFTVSVDATDYTTISASVDLSALGMGSKSLTAASGDTYDATFTVPSGYEVSSYTPTVTVTDAASQSSQSTPSSGVEVDSQDPQDPLSTTVTDPINSNNQGSVSVDVTFGSTPEDGTVNVSLAGSGGSTVYATTSANTGGSTTTASGIDVSGLADGTVTVTAQMTDTADNVNPAGFTAQSTATKDTSTVTVSSIETNDADSDTKVDSAVVTFSEPVSDSSFTASDWSIGGTTVEGVNTGGAADDDTVFLNITTDANEIGGTDVKNVTYTGTSVEDLNGNKLANVGGTDISETDIAEPILVTASVDTTPITEAEVGTSRTVTATFSEDIASGTVVQITGAFGGPVAVSGSASGATWTGTFSPTDQDEDTTATIAVSGAQDAAGNTMSTDTSNTFTVDTLAPSTSWTGYSDGDVVTGTVDLTTQSTINNDDGGSTTYEYSTDGGSTWNDISSPASVDTTGLSDGAVQIEVNDTDDAGNYDASTVDVIVDNTAPSGLTLDSPSSTVYRNTSTTLEVNYSYTDANPNSMQVELVSGSDIAAFNVDDTGYAADGSTKSVTLDLSSPDGTAVDGLTDGQTYDIQLTANDDASKTASTSKSSLVTIDTTAPALNAATTGDSLSGGSTARDTVTVDVTETNQIDASTVEAADFSVDTGQSVTTATVSGTTITLTLDSTLATDAAPTVSVDGSFADVAGNSISSGTQTAADGLRPELLYAEIDHQQSSASSTYVTMTFSEAVDTSGSPTATINGTTSNTGEQDGNTTDSTFTVNLGEVLQTGFHENVTAVSSVTDTSGNTNAATVPSPVEVDSLRRTLSQGWNFVSFPIADNSAPSADSVLDEASTDVVWRYTDGSWESYDPSAPSNDFTTVEGGQGYLVKAASSHTIAPNVNTVFDGSLGPATAPAETQLVDGWNLVGQYQEYHQSADTSGAFDSLLPEELGQIYEQDTSGSLAIATNAGSIQTGHAYWAYAKDDTSYAPN